jgi:hypothetical protein
VRSEAARLVDTLVRAELHAPEAEREVTLVLRLHGYDPHEETIPAAEPMRRLWLNAAVVFHQIRGWADDPGYRRFVVGAATEFDVLRQRFDQLSMKVVRVSETVDRLALWSPSASAASSDDANTAREIITRLYTDLREDVAFFWRNTCLFVAHGVLAVSATAGGRRRRLEAIGFALPTKNRHTSRVLAWAFVTYVVIFVAFRVVPLLLDQSHESRQQIWSGLVRAVMIATVQVVSMMVAILPKFRFGFANEDLHGRVSLSFVLGAGLTAALVAVPIQLWFNLLIYPTPTRAVGSFATSYPWLLMPFATAATFAYLVQDSRWSSLASRARRRLADGLVFATTTVSATSRRTGCCSTSRRTVDGLCCRGSRSPSRSVSRSARWCPRSAGAAISTYDRLVRVSARPLRADRSRRRGPRRTLHAVLSAPVGVQGRHGPRHGRPAPESGGHRACGLGGLQGPPAPLLSELRRVRRRLHLRVP